MVLDLFGDICPRCRALLELSATRCAACGWSAPAPAAAPRSAPASGSASGSAAASVGPAHPTQRLLLTDDDVAAILAELQGCATDPYALRRWASRREVRTALVRAGIQRMSVRLAGRSSSGAWIDLVLVDGVWQRER